MANPLASSSADRHYLFLDGLRGLAATYVMAYHLLAWVPSILPRWITHLQKPLSFGHVAVSIFIVLSGYSLGLPVARSPGRQLSGGLRGYARRRARRILPAYFAAMGVGIVLSMTVGRATDPNASAVDLSAGSVITHALLIHNLWLRYTPTINMSHWSVGAEWQIYFIFAFILLPAWRLAGPLGMILCGYVLAALPLVLLPADYDLHWTCPWYVALFAIGAAAFTFEREQLSRGVRVAMLCLCVVLAAMYVAVHLRSMRFPGDRPGFEFTKDSLAGLIVAIGLVYNVASSHGSQRKPAAVRLLENRALQWLGARSYSLYLIHCSVLALCLWAAGKLRLSAVNSFSLRAFVGIPISIAVASILYRTCERPFIHRRSVAVVASGVG